MSNQLFMRLFYSFFVFSLGLFSFHFLQAQVEAIGNGKSTFAHSDQTRLAKLTFLAEEHLKNSRVDSALFYSNLAIEEEAKSPNIDLRIKNLLVIARAYNLKTQRGSSLKYYLRSVKEIEHTKKQKQLADVLVEIGFLYKDWDAAAKALEYLMSADKLKEALGLTEERAAILEEISDIYENDGSYKKLIENGKLLEKIYAKHDNYALRIATLKRNSRAFNKLNLYKKALQNHLSILALSSVKKDKLQEAYALNEIGYIYKNLEDYKKSLSYFLKFLILCKELNKDNYHFKSYSEALLTIGEIYHSLGDKGELSNYNHALNSYDKKLQVSLKAKDKVGIAKTYNQMSLIYRKLKEYNASVKYGELALAIALKLDDKEILMDSYHHLYKAFEAKNKSNQTLHYYKLYSDVKARLLQEKIERQQELLEEEAADNRKQFIINKTEQMIVGEELDTLNVRKLQLEAEKREKDLALLLIDKELKETELKNEQLKREKALQALLLLQNELEDERKAKEINLLKKDREIQAYQLKQKELEEVERKQAFEMLEKEKALKELQISKQETINKYSIAGICLVTIILCLILFNYLQTRKVNKTLAKQKDHIQLQALNLEKAYKNLELLSKIGQDITASLSVNKITEIAYSNVNKLMDASVFGIGIFNEESKRMEFPSVIENGKSIENIFFTDDEISLANLSFKENREIIIDDLEKDYGKYINGAVPPAKAGERNANSVIYIPLNIKDKNIGVLTVQSFEPFAYSSYHINILRNMAIYVQIALENAGAYREIADKSKILREANNSIRQQKELIEEKNKELIALNHEKNHLIGIVAHDLRNPLAIALSLTDFINQNKNNLSKEQKEGLNITHRSLIRMNEMIERILDVKAVEAKKINLLLEPVDAFKVWEHVVRNFEEKLHEKHLELELDVPAFQTICHLDHNYTIQVFENLLSNAIKFSPKGKKIYINIREKNGCLRMGVADQGPGINPKDFERLFGKYQRLSAKPTNGETSTGLGLSIVKKYVEAMQGKVWCESEYGKGACFMVEFKLEKMTVNS